MDARSERSTRTRLTECGVCHLFFAGTTAFDLHRVGKQAYDLSPERPDGRRCLSADEMPEAGMALDDQGRWYIVRDAEHARRHFDTGTSLRSGQTRTRPESGQMDIQAGPDDLEQRCSFENLGTAA